MGKGPENKAGRLSRRDLIIVAAESVGVALTVLSAVDKSNTPPPARPLSPLSLELLEYNSTKRLRPNLLFSIGNALIMTSITAYLSFRAAEKKISKNPR